MSLLAPGSPKVKDVIDAARGSMKCRIPQRLPPGRSRPSNTINSTPRHKASNSSEPTKLKLEMSSTQNSRFTAKNTSRPRSGESRPKSANRNKEEVFPKQAYYTMRSVKPNERMTIVPKRPPNILKKTIVENNAVPNRGGRPIITVPTAQRAPVKMHPKIPSFLPDQETIKKHEDLELRVSEMSAVAQSFSDCIEESITPRSDKVMKLKICWEEKMVQFEKMKSELKDRQKAIMELYAAMRNTHQIMASLGETSNLPSAEDLRIMNVAKLTPEQLLQLCAGSNEENDSLKSSDEKTHLSIEVNKLYNMPNKLVDTCEQALVKRKEIIDWFKSLTTNEKGISVHTLTKKINEFNAENDMLKCSLDQVKSKFLKDLEEVINLMRKGVNKTMALQLRTEEMTYELSELNSKNADLRKQIHNADDLRSHANKTRIEELEKALKEEKCKRIFLKERLSRAEGQEKMNIDRVAQLEAALEQERSQTWNLERTVKQLHDQNQKLQIEFDKELNKLTESIRQHTVHLEEIVDAREKLQTEKQDLEKRLKELSDYYNESLKNVKHEMNLNVAKLVEIEKKYELEVEDKKRLEGQVESLCAQLVSEELRVKDTVKLLEEKDFELSKATKAFNELEATKRELAQVNIEMADYKNRLSKQTEAIKEIERNFKETVDSVQILKSDLSVKDEYITELEKKQSLIEQQLQENENKMDAYVDQLSSLKSHINQLQEDFGEFENLDELHEMINKQRSKLLEATRQNGELAEALQKKDEELDHYKVTLSDQEHLLAERVDIIKILSEKDEEQTNIVKILRNNLELRSQADNDLSQQLMEKNAEIESLVVNIETRKQQICNLEKIILTLEEQTRKASAQRKKDHETIAILKNKVSEYESYQMESTRSPAPAENLDSLIRILEDELGTEPELNPIERGFTPTKKYAGDCKRDKSDRHDGNNTPTRYQSDQETFPTKIVMGNFVKKTYIPAKEEQYKRDNLDRKKAITNMDTQKWVSTPAPCNNAYAPPPPSMKDNLPNYRPINPGKAGFLRNSQCPNQLLDDKKYKMFKFAGHKL